MFATDGFVELKTKSTEFDGVNEGIGAEIDCCNVGGALNTLFGATGGDELK